MGLCNYKNRITINEDREFVIDINKPRVHVMCRLPSEGKTRKCIANKLIDNKIEWIQIFD